MGRDLTTQEVAERFDVKPDTVKHWCQDGRFKGAYKLGGERRGVWFIPEDALKGFKKPTPRGQYAPRPKALAEPKAAEPTAEEGEG